MKGAVAYIIMIVVLFLGVGFVNTCEIEEDRTPIFERCSHARWCVESANCEERYSDYICERSCKGAKETYEKCGY